MSQQGSQTRPPTAVEWAQQNIAGSFADSTVAGQKLRDAARYCHLVGGASVAPLIEGHEILVTVVPIDYADTYPLKDPRPKDGEEPPPPRRGIGKSTLMQLAAAAGLEWTRSERLDSGRDPRYVHWHVEGRYPQIDGTWRTIEGDRDVDLRDGSDQLHGSTENQIAQLRMNILRAAVTKAKLRAVREAFGVSQGKPVAELDKPFVFARVVFTGRSTDPQIRRAFAQVIAARQIMAAQALYGAPAGALGAAAPALSPIALLASPAPAPVSAANDPDLLDEEPARASDSSPGASAPPAPAPYTPPRPPAPAPTAQGNGGARAPAQAPRGGFTIPGGKEKGKPLTQATDGCLEWWSNTIEQNLASGDARFPDKDRALLAAMKAEIARRTGEVPPDEEPQGDRGANPDDY